MTAYSGRLGINAAFPNTAWGQISCRVWIDDLLAAEEANTVQLRAKRKLVPGNAVTWAVQTRGSDTAQRACFHEQK